MRLMVTFVQLVLRSLALFYIMEIQGEIIIDILKKFDVMQAKTPN